MIQYTAKLRPGTPCEKSENSEAKKKIDCFRNKRRVKIWSELSERILERKVFLKEAGRLWAVRQKMGASKRFIITVFVECRIGVVRKKFIGESCMVDM